MHRAGCADGQEEKEEGDAGVTYRFRRAAGKMCSVLFTAEEGVVGGGECSILG